MICKKHGVAGGGTREGSLEEVTPKPSAGSGHGGAGVCGGGAEPGEIPINRGDHCSAPCRAHLLGIKCCTNTVGLFEGEPNHPLPGKPNHQPSRPRVSVSVEPKQSSGWGGERARLPTAGTFRTGQEAVGEDTGTAARVRSRTSEGHHPLGQRSPTFLAPGTGFVEDNFSKDGGGDGSGGNASDGERQSFTRSPAVQPSSYIPSRVPRVGDPAQGHGNHQWVRKFRGGPGS